MSCSCQPREGGIPPFGQSCAILSAGGHPGQPRAKRSQTSQKACQDSHRPRAPRVDKVEGEISPCSWNDDRNVSLPGDLRHSRASKAAHPDCCKTNLSVLSSEKNQRRARRPCPASVCHPGWLLFTWHRGLLVWSFQIRLAESDTRATRGLGSSVSVCGLGAENPAGCSVGILRACVFQARTERAT